MNEKSIHTFRGDVTGPEFLEYLALLTEKIPVMSSFSVNWAPASVNANTSVERSVAVPGLIADDLVLVTPPGLHPEGIVQGAARATADLLIVGFGNVSGAAVVPALGIYKIFTWRL